MNLTSLTDEELLAEVRQQHSLTTSELELELAKRLEALLDELVAHREMVEVIEDFGTDSAKDLHAALRFQKDYDLPAVREVMEELSRRDIDSAGGMKPLLDIADQICNARDNPLSEGIALLNTIFNPTT